MRATHKMIQYWNTRETASTYDQPIVPGFDPDRYEAAWRAELEGILPPPPGRVYEETVGDPHPWGRYCVVTARNPSG